MEEPRGPGAEKIEGRKVKEEDFGKGTIGESMEKGDRRCCGNGDFW